MAFGSSSSEEHEMPCSLVQQSCYKAATWKRPKEYKWSINKTFEFFSTPTKCDFVVLSWTKRLFSCKLCKSCLQYTRSIYGLNNATQTPPVQKRAQKNKRVIIDTSKQQKSLYPSEINDETSPPQMFEWIQKNSVPCVNELSCWKYTHPSPPASLSTLLTSPLCKPIPGPVSKPLVMSQIMLAGPPPNGEDSLTVPFTVGELHLSSDTEL